MELRPLGFGEIFDRAITLYIRNFMPFFSIVLVLIVPLALMQYVVDRTQSAQIDEIVRVIEHPNATPTVPAFPFTPGELIMLGAVVVLFYLLWPFALNAVAVGVAQLYRGRPVEFGFCYAAVLKRWPAILGILGLEVLFFMAWYVAVIIVTFVSVLVAALLMQASVVIGVVAIIFAGLIILATALTILPLVIVGSFAMYSVVLEDLSPVAALTSGVNRVFTRSEFWRSVLFALAMIAVSMGASMLIVAVTWAALFFHQIAVEVVLNSLLRAAFMPFSIVLIAIYYYDVRIRREGFDLEAELDRLTTGSLVA